MQTWWLALLAAVAAMLSWSCSGRWQIVLVESPSRKPGMGMPPRLVKARTGSHRPPASRSRAHLASFRCLAQSCHGHVKPGHVRAVCNPGTTCHAAVLRLLRVRGHGDELEPSSEPRGIMVQRSPKQELTALQRWPTNAILLVPATSFVPPCLGYSRGFPPLLILWAKDQTRHIELHSLVSLQYGSYITYMTLIYYVVHCKEFTVTCMY